MTASVAIGEFSRLTHLTIKSLRHYHEHGLLVPYAVDEASGYRRYSIDQVPDALLIGRLRALDMPLAEVRRVVDTTSPQERDAAIADHLFRMERELGRTREIVASLRDLLRPPVAPEITPALTSTTWSRSRPPTMSAGTRSAPGVPKPSPSSTRP